MEKTIKTTEEEELQGNYFGKGKGMFGDGLVYQKKIREGCSRKKHRLKIKFE